MSHTEEPVRVVIATDSFLIGDGLASLFADVDYIDVVGRARDHDEILELVDELAPEALIISIRTPVVTTMATIAVARKLRVDHPELGIVVISDRGNGFALELLRGGASRIAYLLDDRLPGLDAVLDALREVRAGQSVLDPSIVDSLVHRRTNSTIDDLTIREVDILEQMAHGLSNQAIATELFVSIKAIEKGVTSIYRKLNLIDQILIDRRVTAAVACLRTQTNPFVPPLRLVGHASPAPKIAGAQ
jgi:DNA-binding NarL/FixJ family response regulator